MKKSESIPVLSVVALRSCSKLGVSGSTGRGADSTTPGVVCSVSGLGAFTS